MNATKGSVATIYARHSNDGEHEESEATHFDIHQFVVIKSVFCEGSGVNFDWERTMRAKQSLTGSANWVCVV